MASIASINIKFSANLSEFSSGMQTAMRELDKVGQQFQKIGAGLTIGVTAPILAFGVASVLAFDQSAQAIAQVEAALKSTGGAVGYNSEQLQKMASDLQSVTTFDDDEILKKATANLLTFSKITGTTFQDAQKAALDLATRLDGDLQSASIQVGKALNDPIKGVSALSKVGVSFSGSQKEMIKSMVNTNDLAGAQAIILKELQTEFGGSAEAAAKAGTGSFKQLANQLGDLSEEFGKIIVEALLPFVGWVKDIVASVQALSPNMKIVIAVVAGLLAAIGPVLVVLGTLATLLPVLATGFTLLTGPIGLVVAGLVAVAFVVANNWGVVKKTLVDVANYFVDLYNSSTVFRGGIEVIILVFKNLWTNVKFVFNAIMSTAQFVVRNIFNYFSTLGKLIKSILTFDVSGVKEALKNGFGDAGNSAGTFFKDLQANSKSASTEMSKNISNAINNTLNGKKLAKFTIPKEKVETAGIANAVEEGVATGAEKGATKAGKTIKRILEEVNSSLKPTEATQGSISSFDARIQELQKFRNEVATTASQVKMAEEAIAKIELEKALKFDPTSLITSVETTESIMNRLAASVSGAKAVLQAEMIDISAVLSQSVTDLAVSVTASFGEAIGGLIAGTASIGDVISGMLGLISGFMSDLGKQLIALGLAKIAFDKIGISGIGAVIAGTALIALATIVKGTLGKKNKTQAFANGGIVNGNSYFGDKIMARVNSAEMISNTDQQKRIWGAMNGGGGMSIVPSLKISGSDLLVVFERANNRKNRTS
jgi:hypothetical protein